MPPKASKTLEWVAPLVVVAASLAPFCQALGFPLLSFDDGAYVTNNALLALPWGDSVRRAFAEPFYAAYQPLTLLTLRLARAVGAGPVPFHAASLVLYAVGCLLVYALLRRLSASVPPALAAAVVFAVHPAHAESASWVSSAKEGLFLAFGAGAALLAASNAQQILRHVGVVALGALAMLSKGTAMSLPFAVAVVGLGQRRSLRAWMPSSAALLVVAVPIAWVNWKAHAAVVVPRISTSSVDIGQGFGSLLRCAVNTVFPVRLAAAYDRPSTAMAVAGGLLLAGLVAGAWLLRRSRPLAAAGIAWFLVTLAPVLGFVPVAFPGADRYLLVPTIGLAMVLADLWRDVRPRRLAWVAVAAVVLSALAFFRARHYRSDLDLWEAAVARAAQMPEARANYATALVDAKRYGEAEAQLKEQIRVAPERAKAWRDLYLFYLLRSPVTADQMQFLIGRWDDLRHHPELTRAAALAARLRRLGAIQAAEQVEGLMARTNIR